MPQAVRRTLEQVGIENIQAGDVFLNNDPYLGGSHCSDYTFMRPVFSGTRLVAIAAARAHMIDVGASVPGSFAGDTTEIHQEGLRLPAVKLDLAGQGGRRPLAPHPHERPRLPRLRGGYEGGPGGPEVAERRVLEYTENYGADTWGAILER